MAPPRHRRASGSLLRHVTARPRRAGLAGAAGLATALVIALSAVGGTGASWTGSAAVRAPSLTSGSVSAAMTGFTGLSTTFSSDSLATTSYVDVMNPGSSHARIVITSSLSADSSSALAAATAFQMWQVDDASKCTTTADPSAAPVIFQYAGNWARGVSLGGDMVPNESDVLCIRSRTSASRLTSTASFTVTFSYTLTEYGGSHWSSTTTASATERTVADPAARSPYSDAVLADGAQRYWRLGESAGPILYDWAATDDAYAGTGPTRGRAGALLHDANPAAGFSGDSAGRAGTRASAPGPQVFTVEAWFRTTSSAGGKIVGFGNGTNLASSTQYDRHLYLDGSGHVAFGVHPGYQAVLQTPNAGYNDGRWHQAIGVLGAAGQQLYVDGALVGADASVTSAESYTGYWRIGGDSSWGTNADFMGDIDEVAVYGSALTGSQIQHHWALGTGVPEARFTSSVSGATVAFDASGSSDTDGTITSDSWDFGDGSASATGTTQTHSFARSGVYTVTLTVTDDSGKSATVSNAVAIADVFAPTAPGAPTTTADLGTSVGLTWPAATDDTAVTAYDVYRDGSLLGSTATRDYTDSGTAVSTTYQYTVRARDAGGNVSAPSAATTVTTATSDRFQVRSTWSSLCIEGAGTSDGSALTQQTCAASPATPQQTFHFAAIGGGYFFVIPGSSSTLTWDVSGASTAPGATVALVTQHAGTNQYWAPVQQPDGSYHFRAQSSGQCLEVVGGSSAAGAGLQQDTCAPGASGQGFTLLPVLP